MLDSLRKSLNEPQDHKQQDDGSWGQGCTEWYRKLEPTIDALQLDSIDPRNLKPLTFMKRLENPGNVFATTSRSCTRAHISKH